MAATTRTKSAAPKPRAGRAPVTDRQRANALLWLGRGGDEVVPNSEIDRILRTMASNHVVRVRRTREGYPVYRVTPAGQRWAVAQLGSSPVHMGRSAYLVRKGDPPVIEERTGGEWRAIDYFRRVRTPWLHGGSRTPIIENAAKTAVRRTDPKKLIAHRHTRDDDWIVVHSL
jgi:hypothetical protein